MPRCGLTVGLIGSMDLITLNRSPVFSVRPSVILPAPWPAGASLWLKARTFNYAEPWPWMHPPRHALGALLLAQGYVDEAEQVYRADLGLDGVLMWAKRHWNNVWSLHGLAECLRVKGKAAELALVEPQLELAMARTDQPITSSCHCRMAAPCCH